MRRLLWTLQSIWVDLFMPGRIFVVATTLMMIAVLITGMQSVETPVESDDARVELGRHLFYDPLLSLDSTTSCASCHQQFSAFAHIDHALSHGVKGRIGKRNVPALQNLADQPTFMWDGALENLDMQALSPLTGHDEMGETLPHILTKLKSSREYPSMFVAAFGDSVISIPHVLEALGSFCATLVSASSRYDRYMAGRDTLAMNEKRGLEVFRGKCASCHAEPLFTNNTFRSNGLPVDSALRDTGRIRLTFDEADRYRFKVPALRNVAVTHPYMHDGRFKRLRDVLGHYGTPSGHADHADPLVKTIGVLRDDQKKDIIAFLLTLTDDDFLRNPKFSDPRR